MSERLARGNPASDSYRVVDKRRVTAAGAIRRPAVQPLPSTPHSRLLDMVTRTWRHVRTHMNRRPAQDALGPEVRWAYLWGLALSARQTHDAVAALLAVRRRPNTLPLQAAILVRSMLECLGNVLALTGAPRSINWFLADGYRRQHEQLSVLKEQFGGQPKWDGWLAQMDQLLAADAAWARLGERRRRRPSDRIHEWPSPYWLTRPKKLRGRARALPVLLKANRARLFTEAYRLWYSKLSALAHQRMAAARTAIFADDPDAHWEPGRIESDVTSQALLFFACIMGELEVSGRMPQSIDLRALWSTLQDIDDEAKRFASIRYRRLLTLPRLVSSRTRT